MLHFTADLHLDHANILSHCARPFVNVHQMNQTLIHNWNQSVSGSDTVYVLGDFAWSSAKPEQVSAWLAQLNGNKILVRGNHDRKNVTNAPGWSSVHDLLKVRYEGERMILCHYAMRVWDGHGRGSWHLYGHSHGSLPAHGLSCDAGVDCWDYTPVSFERVRAHMAYRKQHVVDHHGKAR